MEKWKSTTIPMSRGQVKEACFHNVTENYKIEQNHDSIKEFITGMMICSFRPSLDLPGIRRIWVS